MNTSMEKSIQHDLGQFLLTKEQLSKLDYLNSEQIARARKIKDLCQKKKAVIKQIWASPEGDIEGIFSHYPFSSELAITANQLLSVPDVKLVRDEHRIYFGEIKRSKKSGIGISVYSDGRIYEGHHNDNQKSGLGFQLYKNGNAYIGNFVKNKKHGEGKMYWLNLDENGIVEYYIGHWWDGLPSGVGKHQRCNGDLYVGQFKTGLKHGEGIQRFSNGDVYRGKYMNGLPDGYGEYTWANKSNYKGEFKQGVRSGTGIWKKDDTENCETYNGSYLYDYKQGHGVYNWPDGKQYKGQFQRDRKNGFGQMYHNEVLRYKGRWVDGRPIDNNSQVRDNSMCRMRSSSIQFKYFLVKNKPQQKNESTTSSTLKIMSLRSTTRLRKGTFESGSSGSTTNMGFKKQSSILQIDQKDLTKNSLYKALKTQGKSEMKDTHQQSRCRHKNCIPSYPWQRSQSTFKH